MQKEITALSTSNRHARLRAESEWKERENENYRMV